MLYLVCGPNSHLCKRPYRPCFFQYSSHTLTHHSGEKELQELKTLEDEDDKWNADHEEKCERLDATTNDAIESVTKQIEDKEAQIKEMERALSMDSKSLNELVSRKRAEVDDVLHELSDLQEEKVDLGKFDIDRLHDRRGLTLLSVAALNKDVKTVRVCLEVGASPSVLNADNTRAIGELICISPGRLELFSLLNPQILRTGLGSTRFRICWARRIFRPIAGSI